MKREKMGKTFKINEIYYSIQGEGINAGLPGVFVRFSNCNLTCRRETHGFDCDTEFVTGQEMSQEELIGEILLVASGSTWVFFTGGEPLLQLTTDLVMAIRNQGFRVHLETNGSKPLLPIHFDWVVVSPKVAEHAIKVGTARMDTTVNELRYVRGYGQHIPRPRLKAKWKTISPAFEGDSIDQQTLDWCVQLVKKNPDWRLSVQIHKFLGIR